MKTSAELVSLTLLIYSQCNSNNKMMIYNVADVTTRAPNNGLILIRLRLPKLSHALLCNPHSVSIFRNTAANQQSSAPCCPTQFKTFQGFFVQETKANSRLLIHNLSI